MDTSETPMPAISDPLTWAEICERYPDQHVCLVEVEPPSILEFRTARVVGRGKTRREALEQARPRLDHYCQMGFRFTGRSKAPLIRAPIIFEDGRRYYPPTIILEEEARDDLRSDAHDEDRTMDAPKTLLPPISDPLTWAEICERYPDQYVCLVEVDRIHPKGREFRTARVVGHGKTRREAFEQEQYWWDRYRKIAYYFTGSPHSDPDDEQDVPARPSPKT